MRKPYDQHVPPLPGVLICSVWLAFFCGCSSPDRAGSGKPSSPGRVTAEAPPPRNLPPNAKTLYSMATILASQGKDTDCEFVLRRCLHEYPRFTPAYNRLAELQMRQGRTNEAVDMLSEALRIRPQDPVLLNNLGMCLLVRKEYGKALDQFTQAAGLVPESEKYRANLATALGLLGRQEESFALLQQVLPEDQAKHNAEILRKAREKEVPPTPSAAG
jgi:Flp pilus assembly protein TadD